MKDTFIIDGLIINPIAACVSRQVFHDIAYKAKDRQDLLAGIEEFLDEVIVLPPGEWDPDIRIEPPKSLPSSDKRSAMNPNPSKDRMSPTFIRCLSPSVDI